MKQFIRKIESKYSLMINKIILKNRGGHLGNNVKIRGRLFVRGHGNILIGDNTIINSSLASNPIGGANRTIIHCMGGKITIGNNVGMSNCSIVCRKEVTIGNWVKIGGGVVIYDNDFHSTNYLDRRQADDPNIKCAPIFIDDDAFIGAHSIILKGVHIGKRSIVAAGSVVTKDIPDDELWGGAPAVFIRRLK